MDEEFNEIVRYSENLEGKTYIIGRNESIYSNTFNNEYKRIIDDYLNRKIKYEDIMDKLNRVNKGIQIYEKNQKLYKNSPNIKDQINNSKKFAKGLEKIIVGIDNNKFRIGRDFITEPGSIDLSWIFDPELYEEISQDVFARYNKHKDSNELLSIQTLLDNINKEYIKNKKDPLSEFRIVENNVTSENLRDYIKDLELAIFGYNDEELEYEESIAERTKMRRQNKGTDKKDASRTFAPPDPDSDDSDESTEIYDTPFSTLRDWKMTEEGYNKEGYDGAGYGFNKDEYNKLGFNKDEFNKDGYDGQGFNKDGFNKDGHDNWGFNKDGFNKDGKKK